MNSSIAPPSAQETTFCIQGMFFCLLTTKHRGMFVTHLSLQGILFFDLKWGHSRVPDYCITVVSMSQIKSCYTELSIDGQWSPFSQPVTSALVGCKGAYLAFGKNFWVSASVNNVRVKVSTRHPVMAGFGPLGWSVSFLSLQIVVFYCFSRGRWRYLLVL